MLAYSFLFKSILFCSFIILLTLILYHGEYAGLVYSFLFYFIHLHSVMFVYSVLVLFCSTLCLEWLISILSYSIDSVLTVVYWLHFCSFLFSYIILTFLRFHVQLCCSIFYALLFNYVCQVYFIYSHSIMLRCSAILSSALVRSLLSLFTCTTVESHLLSDKNALGNVRVLIWEVEMFTHFIIYYRDLIFDSSLVVH